MSAAPTESSSTSTFWPAGKRMALSISFDDSRPSQIDVGFPILARYSVPATFYIFPGSAQERLDDWRRAIDANHEIGNHTNTHPCSGNFRFSRQNALETHTLETIERDIDLATEFMEQNLRMTPQTFAFPCNQSFVGRGKTFQSYVPLIMRKFLAARSGFDEKHNHPDFVNLHQCLASDIDGAGFEHVRALIDIAADDNSWLILHGHDVGYGKVQTVHAGVLEQICRHCTQERDDIWVDTIVNVAKHIAHRQSNA